MRAPIEIWQEIIDYLLFDPVLFLPDPYYSGCNLHTALFEWVDGNRGRKLEIQRATLRLVSRSWKILADSSMWQYFEPFPCGERPYQLSRTHRARRIQFSCCSRGYFPLRGDYSCSACSKYWEDVVFGDSDLNIDSLPLRVVILKLPRWTLERPSFEQLGCRADYLLPNLQALFIQVKESLPVSILGLLSRLTFLGVRFYDPDEFSKHLEPVVLHVKSLQLNFCEEITTDLLQNWDMPALSHLEIALTASIRDQRFIYKLVERVGIKLISLRLHFDCDYVSIPRYLWQNMPMLEYFGVSALEHPVATPPALPYGHPLRTFAILEKEIHMSRARSDAMHFVNNWGDLTAVADSHHWKNVPRDFQTKSQPHTGFFHNHTEKFCLKCVDSLYVACEARGLRYEDMTGKTFSEYLSKSS